MNAWLHILDTEGVPWALLDAHGKVLAVGQTPLALTLGDTLPAPEGHPWPLDAPCRAEIAPVGPLRLYPLEDGRVLLLGGETHAALAAMLAAERARLPQFISVLTHELRLPLTSIKGYSDLLAKGVMGEVSAPQRQFLEVIRNNVDRMTTLIDRVSEMGKLASGRLRPQRKPLMIKQIIEGVIKHYRPLCEEKKQSLTVEVPSGLPIVLGDTQRVLQILEAMLDNAYRYTPEGGHITLKAAAHADGVRITVCDDGAGIAPDDAEQVFEPFFRSEAPEIREHPGWGLSLHVARLFAEYMGGAMGFESTPGQGACFWLQLAAAE